MIKNKAILEMLEKKKQEVSCENCKHCNLAAYHSGKWNTKLELSEAIRYMKKDRKFFFRKRSRQGTGMSRSVITPNLSENHLVLGTSGKSRKNKIVSLNEFSFDLLPQKWLSIQKMIDDNGKEKVVFWYEL